MDLKQGMETLKVNKTFRGILSTLLSIGIFLNGNEVYIEKLQNNIWLIPHRASLADSSNVLHYVYVSNKEAHNLAGSSASRRCFWRTSKPFPLEFSQL